MNQKELLKKAQEEHGLGGDSNFFRFEKNGEYRFRQLTPAYPLATYFIGKGIKPRIAYTGIVKPVDGDGKEVKPSVKFVCYVLDRADGQIKLGELPYSVIKVVTDLQEDADYSFADFPMPYDLKVTVNKDAAPAEMYKTLPTPKQEPITAEQAQALADKMAKMTPDQYVEKRKDKQREADAAMAVYEGNATEAQTAIVSPSVLPDYPDAESEGINPEDIPF